MKDDRQRGSILVKLLILIAAAGLVATIYIPSAAMSRAERETAQCRKNLLDLVTFENRCYSETKGYVGTLDSLQAFVTEQTERYQTVVDSLLAFFDTTDDTTGHTLEEVSRAAQLAGRFREYLQYVDDLKTKERYVAAADSVYQYLRYQEDILARQDDFRRLFDEVSQTLGASVLGPDDFAVLSAKLDSLELAFRVDPEQMEAHAGYREAVYLTRALWPAKDRYRAALDRLERYLRSGDRTVEALRAHGETADSLRFCFLFGGDQEANETLERIGDFLAYRADLLERRDGYAELFETVAAYLEDPQRDPELARTQSDYADSLKYCFLFDDAAAVESGAISAGAEKTTQLSQISNFLYGMSSAWNAQMDSLREVVPERERTRHRKAKAELKKRFAEAWSVKLETAQGYAKTLRDLAAEFQATLDRVDEDVSALAELMPAVREALEARMAGDISQAVTLQDLRNQFENNLVGSRSRYELHKKQLARLDPAYFPASHVEMYCPAYPRAMYRLEIESDKVSARCFHREDHGEIKEGDASW